ncbi:MAG TPA: pilus assembly protein [Hyphomicrobiaceae bacterium]|nr:pilus assembly protein [Hyphomicrobiaceae bacterium]
MFMTRFGRPARAWQRLRLIRKNEDGTTAMEFAIVSVPFMMLLFGVMSVSLVYFWIFTLENAVWQASRDMRTGRFQTAEYKDPITGDPLTGSALKKAMSDAFKKAVCDRTVIPSDCQANTRVLVQAQSSFASIAEPNCLKTDNTLIENSDAEAAFDAGSSSTVVVATACYQWKFGGNLPFFKIGNMSDGSFLLQATAAFRTEPYN